MWKHNVDDDVERFEREFCTTEEECDPRKPLIFRGKGVTSNAAYEKRQRAFQPEHYGTSFFVNFGETDLHRLPDEEGSRICQCIMRQYKTIAANAVTRHVGLWNNTCEVMMTSKSTNMNNGEMYAWFWELNISEETAFAVLREILSILRQNHIEISLDDGATHSIPITGFGIRTYNF